MARQKPKNFSKALPWIFKWTSPEGEGIKYCATREEAEDHERWAMDKGYHFTVTFKPGLYFTNIPTIFD